MSEHWFCNIVYVMGDMPKEWKRSTVKPLYNKADNQKGGKLERN
jgi:hypothetical protein